MTLDDFNEKYKDYLERGHYGLDIDNPKVIEYLDGKFQQFIKVSGFKFTQIIMKFNFVCFYAIKIDQQINEVEREILRIIKEAND